MRTCLLIVLIGCWIAPPAYARGVEANPGRPTFSDNAHPMARGHLEMELGAHVWDEDQFGTPFMLKLGLARPVEFKLWFGGLRYNGAGDDGDFGIGNLGLFTKFRFLRQRGMAPAMGFLGGVLLPTASDSVGGGSTDLYFLLLMSGKFGPMGWDFNTGLDIVGLDRSHTDLDVPAILALSATIVGPLGVIMEVAEYIPITGQDNRLHLLFGLTWTFHRQLVMDFAFVKGFGGAPDWELHVGFTATLARLW